MQLHMSTALSLHWRTLATDLPSCQPQSAFRPICCCQQ